jgi:hypothetical protein
MIDRLANVLYWTACAAAVLLVILGIDAARVREEPTSLFVAALAAALVWLAGRAARYVLAGR